MRRGAVVMMMLMTLGSAAWGQDPEKKPMLPPPPEPAAIPLVPTGLGPASYPDLRPGDKAPEFRLDSSLGGTVRLADLKGHWSVLVFEETRTKLAPLGMVGDSIRALGVRPYGVCPDGASALRALASHDRIDFPLLSDPTREISRLFGMYDDGDQTIQSGIVIVDAQGVIRMLLQGPLLHTDEVFQMVKHVLRGT
jgi:mycoredoxin-dependent peroxiredoxin